MTTQPTRMLVQMEVEISPDQSEPVPLWKTMEKLCDVYDDETLLNEIEKGLISVYKYNLYKATKLFWQYDEGEPEWFPSIEGMYRWAFFKLWDFLQESGVYVFTFNSYEDFYNDEEDDGGGIVECYTEDEFTEFRYPDREIHEQALFIRDMILGK